MDLDYGTTEVELDYGTTVQRQKFKLFHYTTTAETTTTTYLTAQFSGNKNFNKNIIVYMFEQFYLANRKGETNLFL